MPGNPVYATQQMGSPAFSSPEQCPLALPAVHAGHMRLSGKTDIFGIAILIYCLMEQIHHPPRLQFHPGGMPHDPTRHAFSPAAIARYSTQLRNLVTGCMSVDPRNRLTTGALGHAISNAIANGRLAQRDWGQPAVAGLGAGTQVLFAQNSPTWHQLRFPMDDAPLNRPPPPDV